jgi:VanZ family protein
MQEEQRLKDFVRIRFTVIVLMACIFVILHLGSQSYNDQSIQPFLKQHVSKSNMSSLPNLTIHYSRDHAVNSKIDPYSFMEFLFRKTVHLTEYGILATLCTLSLKPYREKTRWKVLLTVLLVLLVSLTDELIQYYTPERTSMVKDVWLDLLGGSMGICLVYFTKWLLKSWEKVTKVVF